MTITYRDEEDTVPAVRDAPQAPGITGAEILNGAVGFSKRIVYMSDEMHDALALVAMVSHSIDSFTTLPRGLAVSPKGQAGKSTWLRVLMMLGWNGWKSKPTSYALRARFNDRNHPMIIIDEISSIYGKDGLKNANADVDTVVKEGYENNATLSKARNGLNEDVSCYCVAAFGGLRNAVPDDVYSRCIVWKMKAVPAGIELMDSLDDDTHAMSEQHMLRMHQWARQNAEELKRAFKNFRRPHPKMRTRLRQIWGSLYAVALVAGEDWPERCMAAFRAMAIDTSEEPVLTGAQMVLRDAAALFTESGAPKLFARTIRGHLQGIPDVKLYETLSDRGFGLLMTEALGPAQSMDIGAERAKGWHAKPVLAAWRELEAKLRPATAEDEDEDEFDTMFEIEEITLVT